MRKSKSLFFTVDEATTNTVRVRAYLLLDKYKLFDARNHIRSISYVKPIYLYCKGIKNES